MLRCAVDDDIPAIQAVLNAPENWSKLEAYSDDALRAALDDAAMAILVWEEDGAWQGFCWLRQTLEGTKIEEFGVRAPGGGVGSRLLAAVLTHVADYAFPAPLWLAVAADNAGATRFYERFGFARTALRRAVWTRRAGPVADALIMTHAPRDGPSGAVGDQDVA